MQSDDRMKSEEQSQLALGNKAFREGRYEEALKYYTAIDINNNKLVETSKFNIRLVNNRLKTESIKKNHTINSVFSLSKELEQEILILKEKYLNTFIKNMFSIYYFKKNASLEFNTNDNCLFDLYINNDFFCGTSPGPLFDEEYYYKQIFEKRMCDNYGKPFKGYLHWLKYGVNLKISPSKLYSDAIYLELNKDLISYPSWIFEHFVMHGIKENRKIIHVLDSPNPILLKQDVKYSSSLQNIIENCFTNSDAFDEVHKMDQFYKSNAFIDLFNKALILDPSIGRINEIQFSSIPSLHDSNYYDFKAILKLIPKKQYDVLILMPFCKIGGADFVAGVLSQSLGCNYKNILILTTEQSDWERPDWFNSDAIKVDISNYINCLSNNVKTLILYNMIRVLNVKTVFNVNSRLAFETFERFGERLSIFCQIINYYFCSDINEDGMETGYPVLYFATLLPNSKYAIVDSHALSNKLINRYNLNSYLIEKLKVMYTPATTKTASKTVAFSQVASKKFRQKPIILWAGRFDKQKRVDLLIKIAIEMPEIDFFCWGKAVLDAPPDFSKIPNNLTVNAPFKSFDELPLCESDGWLYTSQWDGLPTILIELGALGMPIVASNVGGVSELINSQTGWLVDNFNNVDAYVEAIRNMLGDDNQRLLRAKSLQDLVNKRHNNKIYKHQIIKMIEDTSRD